MFGDLMGNMQQKQEAMKARLSQIIITESSDGVVIEADAARNIRNISIDKALLSPENKEQIEDLIVIALNRIQEKISATEAVESQKLISDMLPPGMENMFS